ncbi:MAG: hypothetical protein JSW52_10335 [Candidatus Coatesbacteria bacterium]|nr:MAG: hypothetical protein JSW52_10335 [Candidatus Coatesbacteria bacterium]
MRTVKRDYNYLALLILASFLGCNIFTSPGSEHWTEYRLPGNSSIVNDLYVYDDSEGWACTYDGYIYRYDGTDWSLSAYFEPEEPKSEFNRFNIHDIDFSGPDDGWAVAMASSYPHKTGIFHFDGETWSDVTPGVVEDYGMYAVCAVAPDDVWFGGPYGIRGRILHYDGHSFEVVCETLDGIRAIKFVNDDFGIGLARGSIVFYDGTSWRYDVYPICNFRGIDDPGGMCFTSEENGWVVGGYGGGPEQRSYPLALHFDGECWSEVDITDEYITFNDVYSNDGNEVWVVGPDVWNNEGKLWERIEIPSLLGALCVHVTDNGDVWVGCNNGTVLKYKR